MKREARQKRDDVNENAAEKTKRRAALFKISSKTVEIGSSREKRRSYV